MATPRDELLDHEYDGIREYDNPLPRWWLWLFYATILFAAVYTPYYLLGYGDSPREDYRQQMTAAEQQQARRQQQAAAPTPPAGEPAPAPAQADVARGEQIFKQNCVACHGQQAQGMIGPNLTDNAWIHGNTLADVKQVITNGVPEKGMIAWKNQLKPEQIAAVAAYVKSLQGTNPPNPKPPQGERYPEDS